MALADYFLCTICESKTFYDADINYDWPTEPYNRYRSDGAQLPCGVGDIHALCVECAKTYEIVVRPRWLSVDRLGTVSAEQNAINAGEREQKSEENQ